MSQDIQTLQQKVVPILKEAGVTRSSIFGSVARGDNRPDSDVDILVEVPRGTGLFGFIRLQRKLEHALNRKVDLVTYKSIHPLMRDSILREQVPIL